VWRARLAKKHKKLPADCFPPTKQRMPPAVCPGTTQVHVMGDVGDIFVSPRLLELAFCAGWQPKVNRAFAMQWQGWPACAFEVDAESAEGLAWALVSARTKTEWRCACGASIGKYWPNCIRGLVRMCSRRGLFLVFMDVSLSQDDT